MAEVKNCRKCGHIFSYLGGPQICPVCKAKDEEDFKRVKQYLYENPGATISQVSAELDISVEKIKRYLKDGRLEIVGDDGNLILECESCGKAIRSGRFCNDCERGLTRDLKSTASSLSQTLSNTNETWKRGDSLKYLNKNDKGKL